MRVLVLNCGSSSLRFQLVETTPDGAILLRPAGVYPIETYSEDRIREFAEADRMESATSARVARARRTGASREDEPQRRRERRAAEPKPRRTVRRR